MQNLWSLSRNLRGSSRPLSPMSTSHPQPDSPATEELVAYLDGELSADECRQVERRLATDADYRRQLTELEQAWDVLEELPQPAVTDDFARTTIEMVTVAAKQEVTVQSTTRAATSRRQRLIAVAIGLGLAAGAFAAVQTLVASANRILIDNLPVIAQFDVLQQVKDFDFLRGLSRLELPAATPNDTATAFVEAAEELTSAAARRQWIAALPAERKADLASKLERFERLSPAPATQIKLQTLAQEISDSPDRAELQETLARYSAWVQQLTPGKQAELRELASEDRLRRVEQTIQMAKREPRWQLSPEDERGLQEAILHVVEQKRLEFIAELRRQGNREPERRIANMSAAAVASLIVQRELHSDERRHELQDRLTALLSPEAQQHFAGLEGRQRGWQLSQWIRAALRPKFGPEELESFFAGKDLNNDQREYLLSLPQAEMDDQLQQMYMSLQVGLRNDDWLRGMRRNGPGRNGPGRNEPSRERWEEGRGPGERGLREGPPRGFENRGPESRPGEFGGPRRGGPPPWDDASGLKPPPIDRPAGPPPREFGPRPHDNRRPPEHSPPPEALD